MTVTSDPPDIAIVIPLGVDINISATGTQNMPGASFAFFITDPDGNVVVTKTSQIIVSSLTPVSMLIPLLRVDTQNQVPNLGGYRWAIWRVDSGNNRRIGKGPITFNPTPEVQVA